MLLQSHEGCIRCFPAGRMIRMPDSAHCAPMARSWSVRKSRPAGWVGDDPKRKRPGLHSRQPMAREENHIIPQRQTCGNDQRRASRFQDRRRRNHRTQGWRLASRGSEKRIVLIQQTRSIPFPMKTMNSSKCSILAACIATCSMLTAAGAEENQAKPADRMAWWREARFGMFIHWGIYSIPASDDAWYMPFQEDAQCDIWEIRTAIQS